MEISRINGLDFDTLMNVLSSPKITESQKTQFLLKNQSQISTIIETKIKSFDFENLMKKYPEVLKCIPLLLAVRANEIYCQDENGGHLFQFDFCCRKCPELF